MLFCITLLCWGAVPWSGFAENVQQQVVDGLQQENDGLTPLVGSREAGDEEVPLPGTEPPSVWTLLLQVLFSLALVILLIVLLLRFLANRQVAGLNQSGAMKLIGSLAVGNGKTIHLVMLGDSLYLLGVGQDVRLLRHIPPGDELDLILSEVELKPSAVTRIGEWLAQLRGQRQSVTYKEEREASDTFEQLLRKQWREMNQPEHQHSVWLGDEEPNRGEKS